MDSIDDMILFAAVVETGGFSAAARRLRLTKSAVSMRVTKLESDLGVRLLHRTTRQVKLSEAGQIYYQSCAAVSAEAQRARDLLKMFNGEISGKLVVTSPVGFGNRVLIAAVREFMSLHPEMEVELIMDDRNIDLVEGGVDVAVRVAFLENSSLIAKPLVDTTLVLCASPAYFKKNGTPLCVEELENLQWVLFSHLPERLPYVHNGEPKTIQTKGRIKVNNEQARLDLVLAGYGLSLMPLYEAWDGLRDGRLAQVPFDINAPRLPITALMQNRKYMPKKVTAFLEFLKSFLRRQAWAME